MRSSYRSSTGRPAARFAPTIFPTATSMVSAATGGKPGRLSVVSSGCDPVANLEPQALGMTYWFEAAASGSPYAVAIRFDGQRVGARADLGPGDRFSVMGTVDPVIPGSGPIALTARAVNVNHGEWRVVATPVEPPGRARRAATRRRTLAAGSTSGTTGFAPVVRVQAPGARLGAWPACVATGAAIALSVQAVLAAQQQLPLGRVLLISIVACLLGLAGAKAYYLATHRGQQHGLTTTGMSIQGFVLAAIATVIGGGLLAAVPMGQILDVTTPGLLFGMTLGRFGCFFGGCCVGLPTSSRRGLWSSDRRVGVRRIPVQLFESSMAGILGLTALLVVTTSDLPVDGAVFVASIAAYTFGRQLLFPLRGIPRKTVHGRTVTMAITAIVIAADIAVNVLA